ncbi:cytochrome P450 2K6-like [Spea bombifrons]|uniref:cytochrome P450 2K6-like n=1 Tax=Spea bombifrons TaxID=233779 RepID=UPI00234BE20F|nr:cytochrome P450 2K6-like [Spea bombifrons]
MIPIDPATVFYFFVTCVFFLYFSFDWSRSVDRNLPPGPKPLPLIGNLHLVDLWQPYDSLKQFSKKYGSIFTIYSGTKRSVVLCGYETVKDALVNHAEAFSGRARMQILLDYSQGYGVSFSDYENWKVMRRFILSTLRDFGMGKTIIENKINEECDCLVEKLHSYKGEPFENTMLMNSAIANIIISIVIGERFDYDNPRILRIIYLINEILRLFAHPITLLYNTFPSVIRWFPGSHKTVLKYMEELRLFFKEIFINRKKQLDINDQQNVIDAFLVKQRAEKPNPELYFHDQNLRILVTDVFAAGMETTSTTLRWGLLLMMKYPEIQKKVQDEIEEVIGSATPQAEHRKLMPYTDTVIHEIQRFSDIVPIAVPHATTQDVIFRGYFIPKGTEIITFLTSVLKDKAHFEKPDEFYPQHFLDSEGKFVKKEAFIPFCHGLGRRSCIGENLAKMELFLFIIRLLQNFTFQPPPGAELDITPLIGSTTPPKPHYMCAVPRK